MPGFASAAGRIGPARRAGPPDRMLARARVDVVRLEHRCGLRRVLHDAVAVDLDAVTEIRPRRTAGTSSSAAIRFASSAGSCVSCTKSAESARLARSVSPPSSLNLRPARQPVLDCAGDEDRRDSHAVGIGVRDPHQLDLRRLRHRRDLATSLDHRSMSAKKPFGRPLGVAADLAAGRDGRVLVDAEVVDGAAVQPELVAVGIAHQDRAGRVQPVEVVARQLRSARRERLGEEIARVEPDVGALVRGLVGTIEAGLQLGENLRDRAAFVAQVAVGVARAVEVPVDDARHDHAARAGRSPQSAGPRVVPASSLVPTKTIRPSRIARACSNLGALRTLVALRAAEYEDLPVEQDRVRGLRTSDGRDAGRTQQRSHRPTSATAEPICEPCGRAPVPPVQ